MGNSPQSKHPRAARKKKGSVVEAQGVNDQTQAPNSGLKHTDAAVQPSVPHRVTRRSLVDNSNQPKAATHIDGIGHRDKRTVDETTRSTSRAKRAKMVGSSSNQRGSSDDFVDEIPHNELDDHNSSSDDEDAFRSANTRSTTAIFVKAVSGLSDVKKQAVLEMGFGHLLDLKITSLPPKMGFYLVENFNHLDRKLSLYGGEKIHVNEDDVYAALGLPRGSIHIMNKQKRVESSILNEWIGLFNVRRPSNITATKVLEKLEECSDGGDWFKRHFIVLMVTCLFESCQNGMVNFRIVHLLEDLSKVIDMNWCSYMISCLVNSKKTWGGNAKTKKYTGPLLFMTLLYVDKVVLSIRTVLRLFPTFRAWSNELLRDREHAELDSGAFGRGFVDADVSVLDSSRRYDKPCKISSKDDPTRASEKCVQTFVQEFAAKTQILANTGVEILRHVENAPRVLFEDENFVKMQCAAQKLLGVSNDESKLKSRHHNSSHPANVQTGSPGAVPTQLKPSHDVSTEDFKCNVTQITDDAFWNNPDTIAAIDAIIDVVACRDHFRQMQLEDVPSFSLGLSSDEEENVDRCHQSTNAVGISTVVDIPTAYCVTNNIVDDAGAGVVRDDVASDNPDDREVHGRVTGVHSNHVFIVRR
ncbi:Unknown protein [Striga hermonthica]|uniref:Aminotransferase-like plant mobile domain-containing protein n=1 Tax=Striga hermonthica TaxID=68872 RepID=A0A9N7NAD8_STRHE|nr:Unknown protein [Striga hermonthica]